VAQVEGLAARQPVLMLFEDAQWSDPTSLELYDLIIDRVPALPALLIVTFRPEFAPPWTGRPHVGWLALSRLAPRQRAEMIAGVTGGKALPEQIAAQIIDRTDGVPLFVEELTKAVVESGMLTDLGDRYAAKGPAPALAIPASLQASLLARLDRLAPVREVAQIGAALGRQFSHELIAAVAGMPQPQLDDGLAQLVGADLIHRRGTPPDAEYIFKHALVQDAAYSTLLRSRRQQLHAQIAATLEDRFPEVVTAQPALLAQHCEEGGLTEKAVDYWLAAGRQAWGRSAAAEAVALLGRGLALVPNLPDPNSRRERELDLLIVLDRALVANQGWGVPELAEVHSRARDLALALNRRRALLAALWGQRGDHWARGEVRRALQLSEEIIAFGEADGDLPTLAMGYDSSALQYFHLGKFSAGRGSIEKGLALFDPAHRPEYAELLPHDALVLLRVHSAWLLACLGHFDQALFQRGEALEEARRLADPPTLALALSTDWIVGQVLRWELRSLLQPADELLAVSTERGFGLYRAFGLINRGWCVAALGKTDAGIELLTTGLRSVNKKFVIFKPRNLTLLGDACRMAGRFEAALGYFAEARRLAQATEDRWFQAETVRLTGDVLLEMGDPAGAEVCYREAIAIAQRQSAKLWELCSATSLARLWRDRGKRAEARDLLAPVYGWFTEGFGTPLLQEAKALLEELD
jgi:tetratricopeptide (TPR) repeat protein